MRCLRNKACTVQKIYSSSVLWVKKLHVKCFLSNMFTDSNISDLINVVYTS